MRSSVFILSFVLTMYLLGVRSAPSPHKFKRGCPTFELKNNDLCIVDECESDEACSGIMICCFTGCGHICLIPFTDVTSARIIRGRKKYKRGCPLFERRPRDLCFEECDLDEECSDRLICCFTGCGHICMIPFTEEKPGRCPSSRSQNGNCQKKCNHDLECESYYKCCYNGCGNECMKPDSTLSPLPLERMNSDSLKHAKKEDSDESFEDYGFL